MTVLRPLQCSDYRHILTWTVKNEHCFMYMNFLAACMPVHFVYAWCPQSPENIIRGSRTGVTGDVIAAAVC